MPDPTPSQETARLNSHHEFLVHLSNNHLLHPCIPLSSVHRIADIGTGTGIWLQDVAESLHHLGSFSHNHHSHHHPRRHSRQKKKPELVGFDLSAELFPKSEEDGPTKRMRFVVQDVTRPFGTEWRGRFDVVHVRGLQYFLRERDVKAVVENLGEILRPGGYLQWEEMDILDQWATPPTLAAQDTIQLLMREKLARGLTL
ncbi:MAG: hypothetical protein Q9187_002696, partial [Circinaria calcarea]